MLNKLIIKKLFGRFSYNIDLQNKDVTIITGPNGFGKSTILNIIDAISNIDIPFFAKLCFKKITLIDSEIKIEINKNKETIKINDIKIPYCLINKKDYTFEEYINDIPYMRNLTRHRILDRRM